MSDVSLVGGKNASLGEMIGQCLVIGYGNSLRSDDRVGVEVAQIVADWDFPQVRSLNVPQLTPELSMELALVDLAIFVDAYAARVGDQVKMLQIESSSFIGFRSHFGDPRALLSLTQALFGRCPQAWWVLVPGINFELGDCDYEASPNQGFSRMYSVSCRHCLTPTAQQGIEQASNMVRNLLDNFEVRRSINN